MSGAGVGSALAPGDAWPYDVSRYGPAPLALWLRLPEYEFPAPVPEALSPEIKAHIAGQTPPPPPSSAGEVAWRIRLDGYEQTVVDYTDYFDSFLESVDTTAIRELILGGWPDPMGDGAELAVRLLTEAADRFPALRALAVADIPREACEISWIRQCDVTPLPAAFPALETFMVRGGHGLELGPIRHESLRVLRVESGGLPAEAVAGVSGSDLPALEHLDLWLGDEEYGASWEFSDLDGLLSGERLPSLLHLGLQNSTREHEIAAAVAAAPVVARLRSLSLSMGGLTDAGAQMLLSGQPLTHLDELDLGYHFLTETMIERLRAALPGVALDLDCGLEAPEGYEYGSEQIMRYAVVSE